jgi:hypothetical protein
MSQPTTMLGFPVHFSNEVPLLGNAGDLKLVGLCDVVKGAPGDTCWHCGKPEMRLALVSEHQCFCCDGITYGWRCGACRACEAKGCEHTTYIAVAGVRFFGEEAAEIRAKAKARWSAPEVEAVPEPESPKTWRELPPLF